MAEPSILGALRDPQFRSDTLRNLVEALNGAKRSLTVGSLGAAGDMGNTLANLVRAGVGTAYHETTGRPIPQALEYRDPARDFGTSASLGNFAEQQGWLPPQTYSMPEQAGALLGPIVAMKAPDLANSTLRGLVSALKSEPSRRMVEGLVDGMGARPKIFAGEGAQTADMQALAKAQQLEKAGAPERAIWSDTGWFRGADKKWRFEIDDSLARFNPSRADGGIVENAIQNGTPGMNFGPTVGPGMNGNLYHPALFDAYGKGLPQNTFIGNKNTLFGDGVQGAFDSATDSITLNAPVPPRDGRSTLLHELQHAVQQREGFAKGGSVEGMQSLMAKRLDVKSRFDRALEQFMTTSDPIAKGNAQQEMTHYGLELAKLPKADSAGDAYLKLAGEAEARAVQSRMDMTPEQRRATFPFDSYDVPRDKLILRDLLKGPAEAIVWHGSPHQFDAFDSSKIGTGEGAQAYGHGLYLAEAKKVADEYAGKLSSKNVTIPGFSPSNSAENELLTALTARANSTQYGSAASAVMNDLWSVARHGDPTRKAAAQRMLDAMGNAGMPSILDAGSLYKVDLPDPLIARMLDWDKPLSQQAPEVIAALEKSKNKQVKAMLDYAKAPYSKLSGAEGEAKTMGSAYHLMSMNLSGKASADSAKASQLLHKQGIPGIRYLDGGSRADGAGTSNFVVFPGEESALTILERNGKPVRK